VADSPAARELVGNQSSVALSYLKANLSIRQKAKVFHVEHSEATQSLENRVLRRDYPCTDFGAYFITL
jgi:hypothetical protein